ncbi:MAG: right-handed parallel beta-helix repeat-containing protein [Bdellovibrio sp.]
MKIREFSMLIKLVPRLAVLFFGMSLLVFAELSLAATYYVSPNGSDSNNGTSLTSPVKTIKQALIKARSTGDIVYVTAGTYVETVYIDQSGITLSAYQNDKPIIDGGSTLPGRDWGSMIFVAGNNNIISGFEVKNSNINGAYVGGYAIQLSGHHNTVSKVNVHHTWEQGIVINGDYNVLEDSKIWQASYRNANSNLTGATGGWGMGVTAARNNSADALKPGITSYVILRRNTVFNNWGEGISCFAADHCTMEDNIVYDNWATNMYLSDATNSVVQRNLIYISSAPAITMSAHIGLLMADEISSVPRSANNIVINNFIYNAALDAFSWSAVPSSGLKNVLIANNTVVDGSLRTGGSGMINFNSQIRNNIIMGKDNFITDTSGITFSNNNWSVNPPSGAASSSDIIADPQISRTGVTTPGSLTSAYFKVSGNSPVINRAMPLSSVLTDFFNVNRGTAPDIGGYEFVTSGSPSNTVLKAPTGLKVIN